MLIDWFTVGAQLLNFAILVWLMKRFLYQPILNAIDARENKIADQLARAETISQDARQAKADFDTKNSDFEQHREQLMTQASEAANTERQRLLEQAQQAATEFEAKQRQALQSKMQALQSAIRNTAQKELFSMAKKTLQDLAEVDIETQIVAVFAKQLRELDSDQKTALRAAFNTATAHDSEPDKPSAAAIVLVSSNTLSNQQKSKLTNALAEFLGTPPTLQFEQSADLIGGIELRSNGFKIGWSVAEYLHTLEHALAQTINEHIHTAGADTLTKTTTPNAQPEPKPSEHSA